MAEPNIPDAYIKKFYMVNLLLHNLQVTFVGVIRNVQEAATNISFKIDDMTGDFISVRKWLDEEVSSSCI